MVVGVLDFIVELKSFSRDVNKTADDNVIKFRRLLCLILKKKNGIAVTPLLLLFEISVLPVEMEMELWSWSYLCAIQICDSEM